MDFSKITNLFSEFPGIIKYAAALIVVLILILMVAWLLKKIAAGVRSGGRKGARIKVLESTAIDTTRTLTLIRRDNVEHLILLGGQNDLVIESNIAPLSQRPLPTASPIAPAVPAAAATPPATPRPPRSPNTPSGTPTICTSARTGNGNGACSGPNTHSNQTSRGSAGNATRCQSARNSGTANYATPAGATPITSTNSYEYNTPSSPEQPCECS